MLEPRRVPARQPRRQGPDRHPRVAAARPAGPDRRRRPVRDRHRHPRAGRAPAGPAVRHRRPARPVRRLHAVPAARPLQHREPPAGGADPGRCVRRRPGGLAPAAVRVADRPRRLRRAHAPRGCPTPDDVAEIEARIAESTRAWTDQLRAVLVAAHGEQRGRRAVRALRGGVPAGLPRRPQRRHGAARRRPDRGAARRRPARSSTSTGGRPRART